MVIQCGCLDMMWAEDGKLHSQLEWPKVTQTHLNFAFKKLYTSALQLPTKLFKVIQNCFKRIIVNATL